MNNPKFSIITVCYNSDKTIERTIRSILAQTCNDYEYIIVDGASKDSTLDIVKHYEPLFEGRMKWRSEPDKGIYNAMNKGINRASGKIIGIVNSDDWLEPDALEKVNFQSNKDSDNDKCIYSGNIVFHYKNGVNQLREASRERLDKYAKSYDIGVFHPATFVGRQVYLTVGKYDEQFMLNADVDFILRCYQSNIRFNFVRSVLSNMSDCGATNSGMTSKEIADRKLVLKKHCTSNLEYINLYLRCVLKTYLKKILPHSTITKIREK